jgi:hypothetical protein
VEACGFYIPKTTIWLMGYHPDFLIGKGKKAKGEKKAPVFSLSFLLFNKD